MTTTPETPAEGEEAILTCHTCRFLWELSAGSSYCSLTGEAKRPTDAACFDHSDGSVELSPGRGATFTAGDSCPTKGCLGILDYDEGEEESHAHPGQAPAIFCPECGLEFAVDWDRMKTKGKSPND